MTSESAETKWRGRVERWRTSGQTMARFCEEQGYVLGTLRWWSSRLRRKGVAAATKPTEVRIARVIPRKAERLPEATDSARIDVWCAGARVQVPGGADRATLAMIIDVLGGRS